MVILPVVVYHRRPPPYAYIGIGRMAMGLLQGGVWAKNLL